jgi:phenylacetate-CoA ligase
MNEFLKNNDLESASLETVREVQERLLRKHIAYAKKSSPYYKKKLVDFDPVTFSLADLEELPLTDKQTISEFNTDFIAVKSSEVADIVFSSGTTGTPTEVVYTERDLARLGYNEARAFRACGMSDLDTVLLTCTMDRCFVAGLAYFLGARAIGATSIRNGHGTLESHFDVIRRVNPTTVIGVPTFLRKLGFYLTQQGFNLRASSVNKLICIGEPLRNAQMEALVVATDLEKIWGAKVFSTYASSEIVTTFCECTQQAGGHLHPALGLVEILDESGKSVPDGESGEVVVTPLQVEGVPLVRFCTGDISFINREPCACGRTSPRLGPIIGRKNQLLKVRGTSLYPQAVFSALDEMGEISEYYLEVFAEEALSDRLVIHLSFTDHPVEIEELLRRLQARLRVKPEVIIEPESNIRKIIFTPKSRKPVRFIDKRMG